MERTQTKELSGFKKLLYKICLETTAPVFYINGADTLPQPLTVEEEQAVLARFCQSEDRAHETELRNLLIERNLRLVVFIAKKFENTNVGLEDLISIGTVGLIKAINTFQFDKKIKLATYASRCIENEILMFIRKNSNVRHELSIDEPLNVDWDGNELLLSDILGGDEDTVSCAMEADEDRRLIASALSELTERERLIMKLRFGLTAEGADKRDRNTGDGDFHEKTQKEVADLLGISQSYISRLEKKIIRELRAQIAGRI